MSRVPVEIPVPVHGLVLRRWALADAERLLAAIEHSLPELREWMPWASVQPTLLEIGYWVRSDRTGRGYATSAARILTDTGFDCCPDVDRIEIRCHPANLASAAVPPKLGYRLDTSGTGGDLIWAVTRADWRSPR